MGFAAMIPWLMLAVYGARLPRRRLAAAAVMCLGLCLSMAGQLFLLWQDGLLNVATGLPLHICGMMAALSLILVWQKQGWIYELSLYIGMPCALLALVFPAVIASSRPPLMASHFNRVHGLILCVGLFVFLKNKTLPVSGRRAFLLGSVYLWCVWLINPIIGSNYLFLRVAPAGTPLVCLMEKGELYLMCSYEMLAIMMISLMGSLWQKAAKSLTFAGSRRACSRWCRYSLPCTSPNRAPEWLPAWRKAPGPEPDRRRDPA